MGGSGSWNDQNWSDSYGGTTCSCIPSATDEVWITNLPGFSTEIVTVRNGTTARAERVVVEAGSFLLVGESSAGTGQLLIEDPDAGDVGLTIEGAVWIYDILAIKDAPDRAVFVDPTGTLDVKAGGFLDIRPDNGVINVAVRNEGHVITQYEAVIKKWGTINIYDVDDHGILNTSASANFENKGVLSVELTRTTDSDGIHNKNGASFTNYLNGQITLRNMNDTQSEGIDNRALFTNHGEIDVIDVEAAAGVSSAIGPGALFINHGIVDIMNIGFHGIWTHTSGVIRNFGEVNISQTYGNGHHGISNQSEVDNRTGGTIMIQDVDGVNSKGIRSISEFTNDGTIIIDDVSNGEGIYHAGLNNQFLSTGQLTIKNIKKVGLWNDDEGSFINQGNLIIQSVDDFGLLNDKRAIFSNQDVLQIRKSIGSESHALVNRAVSTFSNTNNGQITIGEIQGTDSKGILNSGSAFTNSGSIDISDVQEGTNVENALGTFTNNGTLTIDKSTLDGVLNVGSGSLAANFLNSGTLIVARLLGGNSNGLVNEEFGSFVNQGDMDIYEIPNNGIHNTGNLLNNTGGTLDVYMTTSHGVYNETDGTIENKGDFSIYDIQGEGLSNRGNFDNQSGGDVDIYQIHTHGVNNFPTGRISNAGQMTVRDDAGSGLVRGINNQGYFMNSNNLVVQNYLNPDAIAIQNSDSVRNTGTMTIQNIDQYGLRNQNSAVFLNLKNLQITEAGSGSINAGLLVNESNAIIDIDKSGLGTCLLNPGMITNAGEMIIRCPDGLGLNLFTNNGTADLINQDNGKLLVDQSLNHALRLGPNAFLSNESCGEISITKGLIIVDTTARFDNKGFFFQDHLLGANSNIGQITNSGVIEDRQGSFLGLLDEVTNLGLYAGPLFGHHVSGIHSYMPFLGDRQNITVDPNYYNNGTLSFDVGDYISANNSFLPALDGINTVFITIDNGCMSRVIRQDLSNPTYAFCDDVIDPSNDYGQVEQNWNYPLFWNEFQIPTKCTKAQVPNSKDVSIMAGRMGYAKELEVSVGGEFTVMGELEIGQN